MKTPKTTKKAAQPETRKLVNGPNDGILYPDLEWYWKLTGKTPIFESEIGTLDSTGRGQAQ